MRGPYEEVIRNGCPEGERSERFHSVVFHLARQGWTIDQITNELAKHPNGIGAKYAKRLRREVERSYTKWEKEKRTAATGGPTSSPMGVIPPPGIITPAPPQIIVVPGQLPRVVTEAEGALLRSGNELYQRGSLIVRPVLAPTTVVEDADGWHLIPVVRPYLVDAMTGAARFVHHDRRAKGFVPIDAPDKVAEVYLSRVGRWRVPNLVGIVNTPFLRPDGSICEKPGYDQSTGILFKSDGTKFPPVPLWPSWANAMDALGELKRLTCTFPFVKPADWSVALSAILTTLNRRSLAHAPLHGFTAPTPRTGKSKLVDIVAVLATGRRMPVVAEGPDKRELEKRIGAELLAGRAVISIDNVQRPLSSSFLCQCLTQPRVDVRILGRSESPETPTSAAFFATGNNLVIADDLIGRCLLCSLDARCEHPELREFDEDAVEAARRNRGELVVAGLTILRAWLTAEDDERKKVKVKPLGGFEDWSYRIREPLVWLGESDPVETTFEAKKSDPAWEALTAVVTQWRNRLTVSAGFTVQQVIMRANGDQEFHTALMNVAASKTDDSINNDRLGRWLKRVEGRPIEGVAFKKRGFSDGFPVWSLVTVD